MAENNENEHVTKWKTILKLLCNIKKQSDCVLIGDSTERTLAFSCWM